MILRSQAEIGKELGCTRANVGQSLRRSMRKLYKKVLKEKFAESPFEAFEYLTAMLDLHNEHDISEFYDTLPKNIKEEIKEDAKARHM